MDPIPWVRKWSPFSAQLTQPWKQTPWGHSQIAKKSNNSELGALKKTGAYTTKLGEPPRGRDPDTRGKGRSTHPLLPAFKGVGWENLSTVQPRTLLGGRGVFPLEAGCVKQSRGSFASSGNLGRFQIQRNALFIEVNMYLITAQQFSNSSLSIYKHYRLGT